MIAFACPNCQRLVTFSSFKCLHCGQDFGYDPSARIMRAVDGSSLTHCANAEIAACNWLSEPGELCQSCALTAVRPNDDDPAGLGGFAEAEAAKRWLLFELHELGLPIEDRDRGSKLVFELRSSLQEDVVTGHADGVITLNLDETDPVRRERMRLDMNERYRTVLGHFRHEVGHYYQPILLGDDEELLQRSRELFGDEREDYQEALDRHYQHGAARDWQDSHISAYATMHPWEDWAETFAHYLHLRDALQTAAEYGLTIEGPRLRVSDPAPLNADPRERARDFDALLETWLPLTYALNAVTSSMGENPVYPFVIAAPVRAKLSFIDELVRSAGSAGSTPTASDRSG